MIPRTKARAKPTMSTSITRTLTMMTTWVLGPPTPKPMLQRGEAVVQKYACPTSTSTDLTKGNLRPSPPFISLNPHYGNGMDFFVPCTNMFY